eukprot:TRINITY_DN13808_c0_g2_i3.p2 TRINITY_DN13808_c0_g2~~TRINITY_DN13808_c0_g2_i3.p2  ORF type:complete len:154 (-),score=5.73 TRINITY_DN13808_c0_g2_i3:27-488(-)
MVEESQIRLIAEKISLQKMGQTNNPEFLLRNNGLFPQIQRITGTKYSLQQITDPLKRGKFQGNSLVPQNWYNQTKNPLQRVPLQRDSTVQLKKKRANTQNIQQSFLMSPCKAPKKPHGDQNVVREYQKQEKIRCIPKTYKMIKNQEHSQKHRK